MTDPSVEQALALGTLLHAGVPAIDAIPFAAPVVDPTLWPELARRWPKSKPVLDVRVRLQGGSWTELDDAAKRQTALAFARRCQAWLLIRENPAELKPEEYARWKDALRDLQAVQAGTAGQVDPSAEFFEKFARTFEQQKRTVVKQPSGIQ